MFTVWSLVVVHAQPLIEDHLGLLYRCKHFGIEYFSAECTNETLSITVLPWFSWIDVGYCDLLIQRPIFHYSCYEAADCHCRSECASVFRTGEPARLISTSHPRP